MKHGVFIDHLFLVTQSKPEPILWCTIQKFSCSDGGNIWNSSVRIVGVPTELWTGHFTNTEKSATAAANFHGY